MPRLSLSHGKQDSLTTTRSYSRWAAWSKIPHLVLEGEARFCLVLVLPERICVVGVEEVSSQGMQGRLGLTGHGVRVMPRG